MTMKTNRLSIILFIIVLTGLSIAFIRVVYPFLIDALLAGVLAILFQPLCKKFNLLFPRKKAIGAVLVSLLTVTIVLIPIFFITYTLATQSTKLLTWIMEKSNTINLGEITSHPFFLKVQNSPESLRIKEIIFGSVKELIDIVMKITQNSFVSFSRFIVDFFFIMIFLFFFLLDGEQLIRKIRDAFPVGHTTEKLIFSRLEGVIDATIRGNMIVAIIEGTFGGILVAVYGFPSPLLLAFIMTLLSLIPIVGINFVVIPLGIFRILTGSVASGLSMIIISFFMIALSQNLLKPKIVGDRSGLHPLVVLVSTIGGLAWLGIVGFVVGPVIAALFLTVWETYIRLFVKPNSENHAESAHK